MLYRGTVVVRGFLLPLYVLRTLFAALLVMQHLQ